MKYKYPRTFHVNWSAGVSNDDKVHKNLDHLIGQLVVVTEKMDGENITMGPDYIHARSLDSGSHYTRDYVKGIHGKIRHNIPKNWRVCGESLRYAKSIKYNNLKDFFLVFSIWTNDNKCLSWFDTVLWCELLGLSHVPEIYSGPFSLETLKAIKINETVQEGWVVRPYGEFPFEDFSHLVGKYVRANHVTAPDHWMHMELELNKLL